jgi:CBS domain containing-hemolysin-like protein
MLGALLLAAVLVVANGFFVAAEFALVRVRSTQLDLAATAGSRSARVARGMVEHLDAHLSACQLGITFASLGLGWIGEPLFVLVLHPLFVRLGTSDATSHQIAFLVGFSVISSIHIIVGEQAPKNLAIMRTEATALFIALPLRAAYVLFFPFLWVLNTASNGLLRLFGVRVQTTHGVAMPADELKQVAAESAAEGQITEGERALVSRVFTFSDRKAREIMVPRTKVLFVDALAPLDEAVEHALENGHSRYPLVEGNLDGVVGVLHVKDVTRRIVRGQPIASLRDLARPALFVPETVPAHKLLQQFQRQHSHMAILLDEFGGVTGVCTIEDALEELVGEIQDEHDEEVAPIVPIANGYSVEGRVAVSEVIELLGVPPVEAEASTIAGYVMERLGRIAHVGDTVDLGDWRLRISLVERRTVERLEITRRRPEPESAP